VQGNLVSVQPDDHDRRFKRLSLTHAGRKLEVHLTGTQTKQLAAVFSGAGSKSEAAWKSIMRALPGLTRGVDDVSQRGPVVRRNISQDSRSSSRAVASIP